MTAEQNIRVVQEFFAAWNAKEWDDWGHLHSDQAYHTGPDHAHPLVGRDAILAAHRGLGKVLPDFNYEVVRIFSQDDLVCAEWQLTGTHQGALPAPGGKVEPTGKKIQIPGCFIFRVADGKVAEYAGHVDFLGLYVQLGAIQPLSSDVGRR
jgi:steroid delta-isomerase-like uncharacterized protein